MKKIIIITTSRADYGILEELISKLYNNKKTKLYLLVTGAHSSDRYGATIKEIKKKYSKILIIIKTKHGKDNNEIILENIRKISIEFEKYILKINPNCIIALGDRYELLGISLVNIFYNKNKDEVKLDNYGL